MTFDSSKAAVAARDDLVSRWTADARAANLPDEDLARLTVVAEEIVHEAFHDTITALVENEEARASCIYHSELAADIRDFERRVF